MQCLSLTCLAASQALEREPHAIAWVVLLTRVLFEPMDISPLPSDIWSDTLTRDKLTLGQSANIYFSSTVVLRHYVTLRFKTSGLKAWRAGRFEWQHARPIAARQQQTLWWQMLVWLLRVTWVHNPLSGSFQTILLTHLTYCGRAVIYLGVKGFFQFKKRSQLKLKQSPAYIFPHAKKNAVEQLLGKILNYFLYLILQLPLNCVLCIYKILQTTYSAVL